MSELEEVRKEYNRLQGLKRPDRDKLAEIKLKLRELRKQERENVGDSNSPPNVEDLHVNGASPR